MKYEGYYSMTYITNNWVLWDYQIFNYLCKHNHIRKCYIGPKEFKWVDSENDLGICKYGEEGEINYIIMMRDGEYYILKEFWLKLMKENNIINNIKKG